MRCLRKTFPKAQIDFIVKEQYVELLAGNPHLNNLIPLAEPGDKRALSALCNNLKNRYHTVIDLHTSLRSNFIKRRLGASRILSYNKRRIKRWLLVKTKRNFYGTEFSVPGAYLDALKSIGVADDDKGLEWPGIVSLMDQFYQRAGLDRSSLDKPIALCPGASFATKIWPLDNWEKVLDELLKRDVPLWIFGDQDDYQAGERLRSLAPERIQNFAGKLSISGSAAGISLCRLAVTHDAGPMHIAAAVGTPVVAMFGSTVPAFGFKPFRSPHRLLQAKVSCRPCSHLGFDVCPLRHFRCMQEISPEQVTEAIYNLEAQEFRINSK
ncbi:glycosyltransferase family 9 protein [bacterium]|nr:glycosyltransferase family 9 protein [bacterium]